MEIGIELLKVNPEMESDRNVKKREVCADCIVFELNDN